MSAQNSEIKIKIIIIIINILGKKLVQETEKSKFLDFLVIFLSNRGEILQNNLISRKKSRTVI
jgi:hypothetical protein